MNRITRSIVNSSLSRAIQRCSSINHRCFIRAITTSTPIIDQYALRLGSMASLAIKPVNYSCNIIKRTIKTKKSVSKRFLRCGKTGLRYKHAGKSHLNTMKSRKRKLRLTQRGKLTGTNLKNMNRMLNI